VPDSGPSCSNDKVQFWEVIIKNVGTGSYYFVIGTTVKVHLVNLLFLS
jgi:hypothetical protein